MTEPFVRRAVRRIQYELLLGSKRMVQLVPALTGRNQDKDVCFVAGAQRSGTNMLMDILERSWETEVFHERDNRAFENYELRPIATLQYLVNTSNAKCIVIKALCESQDVHNLLQSFPGSKAIWVVRNFNDVVNSHLALWKGMPAAIGRIVQDRNGAGWRGKGMSDETHALVNKLYKEDITVASACALFWYFRNILYFEQGFDHNERVFLVNYEPLVTNPTTHSKTLFEFLNLQYSPRVSKKVFSKSLNKRQPPIIEPSIREICEDLTSKFAALIPDPAKFVH